MRFDVRQHGRAASISKRAQSTTLTSLRLESTICEQPGTGCRKTLLQTVLSPDVICIQRFADNAETERRRNCVRHNNVPRSLTAILRVGRCSSVRNPKTTFRVDRSI
jgi:hypothetical protein